MQFNEGKFERMSHGDVKNAEKGMYKTKSGKLIEENKTVKDLGVLTSRDVSFSEHIDDLVLSSKIKAGLLSSVENIQNKRGRANVENVQLIHTQ